MTLQMETPPAGGTANGAKSKAGELPMQIITDCRQTATPHRCRPGNTCTSSITNPMAVMIAVMIFAGDAA